MTSMLVANGPFTSVPSFQLETNRGDIVFTDEPKHLRFTMPNICQSQPSIKLNSQDLSRKPRPVFFKARKLDSVAKIAFENELTKPKYRGELGKERMQEAIAVLVAKMHWAIQVGRKKHSKTFELQRSSTGPEIALVAGIWTQEERNLQITDYVKNEHIGETVMTDEEIKEISERIIEFMKQNLQTNGRYDPIYCNCQHFVCLLVPAITNGNNTFLANPNRLPYKWKILRKSPETAYLVSRSRISRMFTGLSSYALASEGRSSELTSSPTESQTPSPISPINQRLLSPQRSLSHRLSASSLRSKTRRRTEPVPSTSISIFQATAPLLHPVLSESRHTSIASSSFADSETPLHPHIANPRVETSSSDDSAFFGPNLHGEPPRTFSALANSSEFKAYIDIMKAINSRLSTLHKAIRTLSGNASDITGRVVKNDAPLMQRANSVG